MKHCPTCGESKPLDEFHRNRRRPDGRQAYCKECTRVTSRNRWAARDPEETRRKHLEWQQQNRASINRRERERHRAEPGLGWRRHFLDRAKAYGFEPVLEPITWADVVAAYGDACAHCGGPFEQLDHYPVAVALGGAHTLANVRPSCADCNHRQARAIGDERKNEKRRAVVR